MLLILLIDLMSVFLKGYRTNTDIFRTIVCCNEILKALASLESINLKPAVGSVRLGRFRAGMLATLTYIRKVLLLIVIGVNERRLCFLHGADPLCLLS